MKQAMILSAGVGLRLRPLTLFRPKPLVPIVNQPLLGILINQLKRAGVTRLAVNTHHLGHFMADFLQGLDAGNMEIQIFHEPVILGTGGGIKNTASFWYDEPLLVINGDLLTDVDLAAAYAYHLSHDSPVTLVMHHHPQYNQVRVNYGGEVTDFHHSTAKGRKGESLLAFTGIHVLDPGILEAIPQGVSHIINTYITLIRNGIPIRAYVASDHVWADVGRPQDYLQLHGDLLTGRVALRNGLLSIAGPVAKADGVCIETGVRLEGWVSLGKNVRLKENSRVANSVLWDNVTVNEGAEVINSVAIDGSFVGGSVEHSVVTPQGVTHVYRQEGLCKCLSGRRPRYIRRPGLLRVSD
jgi:NDP-sugar pyrophosphorylase family protein